LSIFYSDQQGGVDTVAGIGDGDRDRDREEDGTVAAQLDQWIARETVEQRRLFAR